MRPVFRKRQTAQQVEDIPDDLIASIPDVEPKAAPNNPFAPLVQGRQDSFPTEEWRPVTAPMPTPTPTPNGAIPLPAPAAIPLPAPAAIALPAPAAIATAGGGPAPTYNGGARNGGNDANVGAVNHAPSLAPAPRAPMPRRAAAEPPAADLVGLMNDVRRQMEAVFSRELGKIEDTFTVALRQMEERLEQANAEAEDLRREKEDLLRVKADYDRKAEALKELARSFDRTG